MPRAGRPQMPAAGPHELRLAARDGRTLARYDFHGVPVEDGPEDEEHFAFFIPLDSRDMMDLDSIEVRSPRGEARRVHRPQPAAARATPARVERRAPGSLRVHFDPADGIMALIRDRETGQILGMLRGGTADLQTTLPPERVEILISDGVRSRIVR
jgi:hypothetical protein